MKLSLLLALILYVDDGALRAVDPAEPSSRTELATVPADFTVTQLDVSLTGELVLVSGPTGTLFLREGRLERSPCVGPGQASPGGHLILCDTAGGQSLVSVTRSLVRLLPAGLADLAFVGNAPTWLVAREADEVLLVRIPNPSTTQSIGRFAGIHGIHSAPSGEHAVGIQGQGDEERVVVFSLSPGGAPRILGGPATVVAWSPDSRWVGLQFGAVPTLDAPPEEWKELNACAVRAAGGEMMCWTGHALLGFSPDSKQVLVRRGQEVGVASIAGTKPPAPRTVVSTGGAVVWSAR